MSATLPDKLHEVGALIHEAQAQLAGKHEDHEERLQGLDQGLRLELHGLSQEIRTERRISADRQETTDGRYEAVTERIDKLEIAIVRKLEKLERLLTTNGSGGTHG